MHFEMYCIISLHGFYFFKKVASFSIISCISRLVRLLNISELTWSGPMRQTAAWFPEKGLSVNASTMYIGMAMLSSVEFACPRIGKEWGKKSVSHQVGLNNSICCLFCLYVHGSPNTVPQPSSEMSTMNGQNVNHELLFYI